MKIEAAKEAAGIGVYSPEELAEQEQEESEDE